MRIESGFITLTSGISEIDIYIPNINGMEDSGGAMRETVGCKTLIYIKNDNVYVNETREQIKEAIKKSGYQL